jgi:MFS family permease
MSRNSTSFPLSPIEKRAALTLASVFALRMLGLFLILPVFALYADQLQGATPLLVGLAIGAYGLTQAMLQIPFGALSDKVGRKPVIVFGLLLFAAGSVLAASAETIEGVIFGRFIQGAGAIAASVMALAADLTRETSRTRIMAMIGMSIGMSFILSLILGPLLAPLYGVSGIFWITAALALLGVVVVIWFVPSPQHSSLHRDAEPVPGMIGKALTDSSLLRLNFGVFVLHMSMTAVFLVVPLLLRDRFQLETVDHWQLYLPVMLLSMGLMVPFVIVAEKHRRMKEMYLLGVAALIGVLAMISIVEGGGLVLFALLMVLYFAAFNLLEAIMPSWVSKVAAAEMRGTAMGVFASSQFAGAFAGGLIGGWVHQAFGLSAVFQFAALAALVWLAIAVSIQRPRHLANYLLPLEGVDSEQVSGITERLLALDGVEAVHVIIEDDIAYMKVDNELFDPDAVAAGVR